MLDIQIQKEDDRDTTDANTDAGTEAVSRARPVTREINKGSWRGVSLKSTIMTRHWEPGVSYNVGELLEYHGQRFKVIQAHSSQVSTLPARDLTL